MSEKEGTGIVYYRSKTHAFGAISVGCILLAFALLVLTRDGIAGIRFSDGLAMMSIFLAAPLGIVMILANIRHAIATGPTMTAGPDGIGILFTDHPVVLIHWTEITKIFSFKHQGRPFLAVTAENPINTFTPFTETAAELFRRVGPSAAHIKVEGKMLDDPMHRIVNDLEEMRQIHSWRT